MSAVEYMQSLLSGVAKACRHGVPETTDVLAQDEDGRASLVVEDSIIAGTPGDLLMRDVYLVDGQFVGVEYRAGNTRFGPKDWSVSRVEAISLPPVLSY